MTRLWMAARALTLTLLALFATGATAQQEQAFVQIEAHSTLQTATDRARAYATIISDINGFSLGAGWYGLSIGPYDRQTALETLQRLRREGLIPRDSFVSDGRNYREQFWPVGTNVLTAPANDPEIEVTPIEEAPVAEAAPEAAPEVAVEAVPETPVVVEEPEETLREAQRSERALDRDARRDLQTALQWFGHYTAAIDGAFGPGTRRSMRLWQEEQGLEATGVLTTRQRAQLLGDYQAALDALGLRSITDDVAGIALEAPMGLVQFERHEAPFAHYGPKDDSGVRMILVSQEGDQGTMNGLYEILQTLDIIPPTGARSKSRNGFEIRGEGTDFTSQTVVKLSDRHIHGFILVWPPAQEGNVGRVMDTMTSTLASVGAPMDPVAGFDPSQQSVDMVSGLDVRQALRSRSGVFIDGAGRVLTSATAVQGCGRVTIDKLHDADVTHIDAATGTAIVTPKTRLAPMQVAGFASSEPRLRSPISVAGFPYEGILGAATLTFGTLEDVRGLDGDETVQRLTLTAQNGDAGGPVFDETGAVTGLLLPATEGAQALPQGVSFARKASALREVLQSQGIAVQTAAQTGAIAPEDLTILAADMTVLVSCWEQ